MELFQLGFGGGGGCDGVLSRVIYGSKERGKSFCIGLHGFFQSSQSVYGFAVCKLLVLMFMRDLFSLCEMLCTVNYKVLVGFPAVLI